MQLRCKCGFTQNWTIHKDGLEAVSFTCESCRVKARRASIQPNYVYVRVSSVRAIMFRKSSGRVVER